MCTAASADADAAADTALGTAAAIDDNVFVLEMLPSWFTLEFCWLTAAVLDRRCCCCFVVVGLGALGSYL